MLDASEGVEGGDGGISMTKPKPKLPWWLKPKPGHSGPPAALPPVPYVEPEFAQLLKREQVSLQDAHRSPVVRSWINHNRRSKYIPEEVLEKLGGVNQ